MKTTHIEGLKNQNRPIPGIWFREIQSKASQIAKKIPSTRNRTKNPAPRDDRKPTEAPEKNTPMAKIAGTVSAINVKNTIYKVFLSISINGNDDF